MKIKVIGKAHLKGTSHRTGNAYDFIQVHYNGPAQGVVGLAALTVNLDPANMNFDSITIPGDYNVEFDQRGYPVVFHNPFPVSKDLLWMIIFRERIFRVITVMLVFLVMTRL